MLQILKKTPSSKFQAQSEICLKYIVKILFHTCYLYKHQVEYYEKMVYNILEKDIGLILPKFGNTETNVHSKCLKRQIISALISGFIGLAFEGISSYLQHK